MSEGFAFDKTGFFFLLCILQATLEPKNGLHKTFDIVILRHEMT